MALRFLRGALADSQSEFSFLDLLNRAVIAMARAGELDESIGRLSPPSEAWSRAKSMPPRGSEAIRGVTAAFFEILALGYVVPQASFSASAPGGLNFSALTVTDAGRAWAKSADPIPEDPTGYLVTLDKLVPTVDRVIRQYVAEALVVYERRAFFAAAVMIGAASEATIYVLADSVAAALTNPTEKGNLERALQRHEIAEILKRISGAIDRAKEPSGSMPYSVFEGADHYLLALQDSIRVQRNEAGHPAAGKVEPASVRLALSAFPTACRKAHDLLDWFRANTV